MEHETDDADLGPAMLALTDRQRKFVRAVIDLGRGGIQNNSRAAKIAGYSDSSPGYLRFIGHTLAHDARIQGAILEESRRSINLAAAAIATPVVIEIAMNESFDARDRLRACEMLFNRGGIPAQTEHKVTVEHRQPKQILELASKLAKEIGIDEQRLLGLNRAAKPVLDGEFVEVEGDGG